MSSLRWSAPLLLTVLPSLAAAAPGYLRYPDLHGDTVVFSAEGDLWTASIQGGAAQRVTAHEGTERYPHFSPDGSMLAFTENYDGNADVYVMPVTGGEPRRLTWHPRDDELLGWWDDGQSVVFRSRRDCPHGRSTYLYTVPVDGGAVEQLPLGWAANIDVDAETGLYAFNRISREHRTWKRYRGGTAQDLWVGHPERQDYQQVTSFEGTDAFPMWHGGRLYFLSDEGGTANIWSMAADGSDRTQHTRETEWDLRWPAMGPDGRILAMRAGDLVLVNPADDSSRILQIDLASERVLTRQRYPDASEHLSWFHVSPEGDRVVIVTRGEVFSVPVEDGVTLPVTRGSGARESWASYDPEGERMVYVTDASGEEAIVTADAWGRGDEKVVVKPGKSGWHFAPVFSPDGKWIAYADQTRTLYVVSSKGGRPRKVDQSEQWEMTQYSWSPDGRWLAYTRLERGDFSSIHVYDTQDDVSRQVTGPSTDDGFPCWDPDGRYLYFASGRHINPHLGRRDFQYILTGATQLYALLLRADVDNPLLDLEGLPPEDDDEEEEDEKKGKDDEDDEDEEEEETTEPVEIEFEGLPERLITLPVDPGNYHSLAATSGKLFYMSNPTTRGMADHGGDGPSGQLMAFDWEEEEADVFMSGVGGYELAMGGEKLAVSKDWGSIYVVGTEGAPGDDLSDAQVSLGDVVVELDPREEWQQIYRESWRHMRDFFWDPDLGGLDWNAVGDRYASLLPRIATRDDLRDVVGELIGELATSHTYVWGGDMAQGPDYRSIGLLGCDVERDDKAWKVTRIYRGDPADNARSPLAEPGVEVSEGEYILAVNHQPLSVDEPFYAAFDDLAGQALVLTVSENTSGKNSRDVVVTPGGDEQRLRYVDWVRKNREYVKEQTDGAMGYLHIPNMGTAGLVAFETWFHPQLDKQGLVVDVRWNGGGFVSQLILERLRRSLVGYGRSAAGGLWTYPQRVLNGPFVVITNEHAGSDGDIFPMAVQVLGLAPVIGQRSWGGVVGIRGDKPMVDGGGLTQPEFAFWFPGTGWGLENRGVEPDIEVQNLPQDLAVGKDPQLDAAIAELTRLRAEGDWLEPDFEDEPIKTRKVYREREAAE